MFKKLIPIIMLVFIAACTNVQGSSSSGMATPCECCEKCDCCKDMQCPMHKGKMSNMSVPKEGEQCKICLKANKTNSGKK
jgi:hypothetical protein